MADLVSKPEVLAFLDNLSGTEGGLSLVKFSISNMRSEFKNKTLAQLQLRVNTGVNILGYKSKTEEYIYNPPANMILEDGGLLMVLGKEDELNRFKEKYTNQSV